MNFADWSIFESDLHGNYQIGMMGWGAYYNDPYDMLSIHLSNANQIYTGWSNEEYDKLTKAGVIELDPEKRMQDYIAAEKILFRRICNRSICNNCSASVHKRLYA